MSRLLHSLAILSTVTSVASAGTFASPPPASSMPHIMPPIDVEQRELPTRDQVRKALAAARAQNVAFFQSYVKTGRYPHNVVVKGPANIWRDFEGNFCAAATIMVKSGNRDLAIQIAENNNFLRLADVKQGPVMDWILTTGFTQEELVLIQKPFRPVTHTPTLEPDAPVVVDAKLRRLETARLLAKYKVVAKQLTAQRKRSLELAVDRLMKHPELAWQLVDAQS